MEYARECLCSCREFRRSRVAPPLLVGVVLRMVCWLVWNACSRARGMWFSVGLSFEFATITLKCGSRYIFMADATT